VIAPARDPAMPRKLISDQIDADFVPACGETVTGARASATATDPPRIMAADISNAPAVAPFSIREF